ncbi:methyltransferase domain-containing protein [Thermodesulfobacteriota bacterium]
MNCHICNNKYERGFRSDIRRCPSCGHSFRLFDGDIIDFHTKEYRKNLLNARSQDEFNDNGSIAPKFHQNRQKIVNSRLNHVRKYLKKNFSCLDVGAGAGTFAEKIKPFVNLVECLELDDSLVSECNRLGFITYQNDFMKHKFNKKYDFIFLWHVLEHVENVTEFMAKVFELTNKYVVVEIPFGRVIPERFDGHLQYFSEKSFRILLKKFHILKMLPGIQKPSRLAVLAKKYLIMGIPLPSMHYVLSRDKKIFKQLRGDYRLEAEMQKMHNRLENDRNKINRRFDRLENATKKLENRTKKLENATKKLEKTIKTENQRLWLWLGSPDEVQETSFLQDGLKINIGAGRSWFSEGWETVDYYFEADYQVDLRESDPLPFENDAVSVFFASHVIEHLSNEAAQNLLNECYRSLVVGGVLRISAPSYEKAEMAYRINDSNFFEYGGVRCVGDSLDKMFVNYFASYKLEGYSGGPPVNDEDVKRIYSETKEPEEFIQWCVSQIPPSASYIAHINGYTYNKLKEMIGKAGFKLIVQSSYRASCVPELRSPHFDNRPRVSLYMEAVKE